MLSLLLLVLSHGQAQGCSTTVAEFIAMAETSKEAVWLSRLIRYFHAPHQDPIVTMCNNQGAIQNVRNPIFHKQTKHLCVKVFFSRELYERNQVEFRYISSTDQVSRRGKVSPVNFSTSELVLLVNFLHVYFYVN